MMFEGLIVSVVITAVFVGLLWLLFWGFDDTDQEEDFFYGGVK